MNTVGVIVGVILIVVYIVCAIMFIHECETTTGTVWATIGAVGIGALIACFIEYLVTIAIIGIALALIGAVAD